MPVGERQFCLNSAHDYKQKPAESKASVHIAEQKVLLRNAPMQQTFAERLPDGRQKAPSPNILADFCSLQLIEFLDPAPIFPHRENQKEKHTGNERNHKQMETVTIHCYLLHS